jgi:hypothetical protein
MGQKIVDSDSLTETKNWRGRNEVTETSGRLHPLWPQNKRLRTPWTTDRMHTRQDIWIQKELAFTVAKNATKPKPFEIISLQTTRKKNNWKTEETLARTVVTLETERIKGSNPWCLWWWWWFVTFYVICSVFGYDSVPLEASDISRSDRVVI